MDEISETGNSNEETDKNATSDSSSEYGHVDLCDG